MKRYLVYLCSLALILTMLTDTRYTFQAAAASMDNVAFGRFTLEGYIFSEEEQQWIDEAKQKLHKILEERTVMALVYLSDIYPVREEADGQSAVVAEVPSGQQVQIKDVMINSSYEVWEYVSFYYQGQEYTGYVERANLACSDEIFLKWESDYGMNLSARGLMSLNEDGTQVYADVEQFPESYRELLKALKEAHPNWTFVKMNTNLDWNEVVENQMVRGRNLIPSSFPDYMWDETYSPNWAYVTEGSLKYYLDPRNGLTEEGIFQFEQLTYNESYHTEPALESFLNNTFMVGNVPNTVLSYAYTFFKIGEELGVSPFHLACRVYQEQGNGTSALISGTYPGYEGCYNYFNIGAFGETTEEIIVTGLEYAKKAKWTDADHPESGGVYYSICGGAEIVSANYILQGQDTLYLQKFDVDNSYNGLYWHQYMQNVCAPTSEGKNIRKSYQDAGSLENTFVFKIPVYDNMPAEACQLDYVGDINSELIYFDLKQADNGGYYLTGQIVVVEWIDGVSTVPEDVPTMNFKSTDGVEEIEVFVTPTGSNTYYFDRFIEGLTEGRQYVFEITSGSERNLSLHKSMNVNLATSPTVPAEKDLGSIGEQNISYFQSNDGELRLYGHGTTYVGNINSELKKTELVRGANGNYVSGEIVVVEWVNGISTVPKMTPIMYFKSTDGLESLPVFISVTGTNTYYFDRSLGDMDTCKEYVFTIESGDETNVSIYRAMIVTTAALENKDGTLWESETQYVRYRTDANTAELRIYAVNK